MNYTTVLLAGGPPDDVAALEPGAANKAFVRIAGVPLAQRALAALRAASSVGRIVVVAPPSTHGDDAFALADECRPDGTRIRDSLRSGLAGLDPDAPAIVAASDLPILTPESVDDFAQRVARIDPDVGYGCLEKQTHMARFPEVPHTWVRLLDGIYCGGGLMSIKPRAYPLLERFIERLGSARKNPLKLASLLGWGIGVRFALGRLSIAGAERRASEMLGASARAIVSPYAETAVNVDRVSDVALAERLVATPASASG
jgi:GTP:adenosylcobinamide-phosphate guanylyltransferase